MQVLGGILFIPKLHPSLLEGIGPNAIIFTLQIEFTQNGIDILLRKLLFDFLYIRYDARMGSPVYDNGDIICLKTVPVPEYTGLYINSVSLLSNKYSLHYFSGSDSSSSNRFLISPRAPSKYSIWFFNISTSCCFVMA